MQNNRKFDEDRVKSNQELISLLSKLSIENPSLRFSQLLVVFGFVEDAIPGQSEYWKNEFNVEPQTVLKRVKNISHNK